MNLFSANLTILLTLSLILQGCVVYRPIDKNDRLIVENRIFQDSVLVKNDPVSLVLTTKPNQQFIGIPFRLMLYKRAHPKPGELFKDWLDKKPKRAEKFNRILSEKQVQGIQKNFIKFHEWLKKTGEPPTLLDSVAIKKSKKRIVQYFKNLGYFDVKVETKEILLNENKIALAYKINKNKRYIIDSIQLKSESSAIRSIYEKNKEEQLIKKGAPFEVKNFDLFPKYGLPDSNLPQSYPVIAEPNPIPPFHSEEDLHPIPNLPYQTPSR